MLKYTLKTQTGLHITWYHQEAMNERKKLAWKGDKCFSVSAINHYSHEHYLAHHSSSCSTLTAAALGKKSTTKIDAPTAEPITKRSFPWCGATNKQMKANIFDHVRAIGPSHSALGHKLLPPLQAEIDSTLSVVSAPAFDYTVRHLSFFDCIH